MKTKNEKTSLDQLRNDAWFLRFIVKWGLWLLVIVVIWKLAT